jgi:hypothetical protein
MANYAILTYFEVFESNEPIFYWNNCTPIKIIVCYDIYHNFLLIAFLAASQMQKKSFSILLIFSDNRHQNGSTLNFKTTEAICLQVSWFYKVLVTFKCCKLIGVLRVWVSLIRLFSTKSCST